MKSSGFRERLVCSAKVQEKTKTADHYVQISKIVTVLAGEESTVILVLIFSIGVRKRKGSGP